MDRHDPFLIIIHLVTDVTECTVEISLLSRMNGITGHASSTVKWGQLLLPLFHVFYPI